MPGVLPSSVRDFIGTLTAYIIPASLDLLANDLQLMAEDEPGPSGQSAESSSRQAWSDAEINTLISYLYEHRDKMSGGGSEDVVWTGLRKLLADKHHITRSQPSMKAKLSEVHNFL